MIKTIFFHLNLWTKTATDFTFCRSILPCRLSSLRKLDVSLKEIKAYLKSKDINLLKDIYRNKQQEYKKQIEELLYLEKTMQQKISFLNDIQNLPLNQILLELQEEEHLYFSEDISFQTPIKHRMNILAKHMLPVFSHPSLYNVFRLIKVTYNPY